MSLSFFAAVPRPVLRRVPCRIGLGQLSKLIATVLDGTAGHGHLGHYRENGVTVVNTADCAIGRDAARLVLDGLRLPG